MKTLRSALILVFLIISSIVYAGGESSNVKVKARFFFDKLYISSDSKIDTDLQLYVFTDNGDVKTSAYFNLSEGKFVLDAGKFEKGTYCYFVKGTENLLVKGSFVKE